MLNKLKLLLPVFFLINCTKEIDFSLDNEIESLAVSCKFNEKGFSLFFSGTTGILDGEYPDIGRLQVKLFENDSAIYNSVVDTNHLYINYYAKAGTPYKLVVGDTSGNIRTGNATMPKKVSLGQCSMKMTENKYVNDLGNIRYNEASVTFTDPEDERNYYELLIYHVIDDNHAEKFGYWTSYESEDPVLQAEGDLEYGPSTIFFSDGLFNGEKYTLTLYSSDGSGNCSFGTCIPNEHRVELRSISKDYYLYLKYFTRHYHNQQTVDGEPGLDMLFQGEPVDMYSNIENGFGIFAGYSSDTRDFKLISAPQ